MKIKNFIRKAMIVALFAGSVALVSCAQDFCPTYQTALERARTR